MTAPSSPYPLGLGTQRLFAHPMPTVKDVKRFLDDIDRLAETPNRLVETYHQLAHRALCHLPGGLISGFHLSSEMQALYGRHPEIRALPASSAFLDVIGETSVDAAYLLKTYRRLVIVAVQFMAPSVLAGFCQSEVMQRLRSRIITSCEPVGQVA